MLFIFLTFVACLRFEFLKRSFIIEIIAIKIAGKVLWPKIQWIFGHPIGTTTSAWTLFAHQHWTGHIWSIRCPNQVIQKPKFIYTFRDTTFMKRPKWWKIIWRTKTWCKLDDGIRFVIYQRLERFSLQHLSPIF